MIQSQGTECELPADFNASLRYEHLETSPGDVYVFSGRTPHWSVPNESDRDRTVFYASYALERDCGQIALAGAIPDSILGGTGAGAAPVTFRGRCGGCWPKPGPVLGILLVLLGMDRSDPGEL